MKCLKCGREIPSEQVFCEDCLLVMQKCPVDDDTPVRLPKRTEYIAQRKPAVKKRTIPLEDQIHVLKKRVYVLSALVLICVILILLMAKPAIAYWKEDHFALGQNYSSITSTTSARD